MKSMKTMIAALVATTGLVGCQKAAEQVKNEVQKKAVNAELVGNWYLECKGSDLLSAGSERTKYDFAIQGSKTIELFSDGGCRDKVGEIKYTGRVEVGNETPVEGARILTMEYNKVSVKIDKQEVVDQLNKAWVPSCGINDLQAGQERDVTEQTRNKSGDKKEAKTAIGKVVEGAVDAVKEAVQCPIKEAKPVYDIVKIEDRQEGKRVVFGKSTAGHDKSDKDKRPTELDRDPKNELKKEG